MTAMAEKTGLQDLQSAMARPPFDDSNGDLVIRSSDNVHFYTHITLLAILSPVFSTMFQLPRGAAEEVNELWEGKPVLDLEEQSTVVHQFLMWCDPRCIPDITNISDTLSALAMAHKYDMSSTMMRIEDRLLLDPSVLSLHAQEAYVVATRCQRHKLVSAAAKETLLFPISERKSFPQLRNITALSYAYLLEYYLACSKAASAVAASHSTWIPNTHRFDACNGRHVSASESGKSPNKPNSSCHWWAEYMAAAEKELCNRPRGKTATRLEFVTPFFKRATTCPGSTCRLNGYAEVKLFLETFEAQVETAISKIELQVDF